MTYILFVYNIFDIGITVAPQMSLKETASRCFLHINTLQYQLKHIRDYCSLDC